MRGIAKARFFLPALAAALVAGCAATPPAAEPQAQSVPVAPSASTAPVPPAAAPPTAPVAAVAPAAPASPGFLLPPEQRRQAERVAAQALEKAIGPARGDRQKMRKVLVIPATSPSRTERYMGERIIDAFMDPLLVNQLVANMSDTQLQQIQSHPSLALEVAGGTIGKAQNFGFNSLNSDQEKAFLEVFGEIYGEATPQECGEIFDHKVGGIAGGAMTAVLDRLPEDTGHRFTNLIILALRQPHQAQPAPLSAQERELVVLNVSHYFNTQPEEVRTRFQQYYHGTKLPSDRCWAVAQTVKALLSGDEQLSALGTRMFMQSLATGKVN